MRSRFLLFVGITFLVLAGATTAPQAERFWKLDGRIKAPYSADLQVFLKGPDYTLTALPNDELKFTFPNLQTGTYYLDVSSLHYTFATYKVEVNVKESGKVRVRLAGDSSSPNIESLTIQPLAPIQYIEERQPFDLIGFVKSPMVIMIGVSLFMVAVFPILSKQMDIEKLKEEMANPTKTGPTPEQILINSLTEQEQT